MLNSRYSAEVEAALAYRGHPIFRDYASWMLIDRIGDLTNVIERRMMQR